MPATRKLVAIMFTDIVGYTALMQQSEQKAIEIRNKHRKIFNELTHTILTAKSFNIMEMEH